MKETKTYIFFEGKRHYCACQFGVGGIVSHRFGRFARAFILREGYFVVDPDTTPEHLVFNRVVGLRDSWAKAKKK